MKQLRAFIIGCFVLLFIGGMFALATFTAYSVDKISDHHYIWILGLVPAFLTVTLIIGNFIMETR